MIVFIFGRQGEQADRVDRTPPSFAAAQIQVGQPAKRTLNGPHIPKNKSKKLNPPSSTSYPRARSPSHDGANRESSLERRKTVLGSHVLDEVNDTMEGERGQVMLVTASLRAREARNTHRLE